MPARSPVLERHPAKAGPSAADAARAQWRDAYLAVRAETERRVAPLSPEDQVIQSMPDASPIKWHRAHTTWFFEQFLLVPHLSGYRPYDDRFAFLFNSYYVAAGPRHARPERGMITRPSVAEVAIYRAHVDAAVVELIEGAGGAVLDAIVPIIEIGLNHEQQHQELMLTDILHAFSQNPTAPAYQADWVDAPGGRAVTSATETGAPDWILQRRGIHAIGHDGKTFCFDNETPRHEGLLHDMRIARRLVTNADWLAFMADGGYATPSLWLSDGWAMAQAGGWIAPGYWQERGEWHALTLGGLKPVDPRAPVRHVSYYEADAFARWAGKHLPTETEWEVAARDLEDAFGAVWQWTRSAYLPYPGYRAVEGALGEYNGKFMVNQMVLRGSSVATPQGHSRVTYRNFFYPQARWQFTGLRLVDYSA